MKLLITTGVYPPESGGPATYTKLLEERLPGHGFTVEVLPFQKVRHLPRGVRHVAYLFLCMWMSWGVEVVYAQDTVSVGVPAAIASMLMRKKFVVRVPGDYAWEQGVLRFGVKDSLDEFQNKTYGWQIELLRLLQRFVLRCAKRVVVPSAYMQRTITSWGRNMRSEVIYSSVSLPHTETVSRPEGFLVVSAGRRVPWKRFDHIEAVVAKEKGWHFFLASDMSRTEALSWVKAADVFVLNSTYEGLSHVLVEAMMLGTPVVATRVGGNPELIRDGVDGILVSQDDEALHRALREVCDNAEAARERAASAKERAQMFSIESTIEAIATLLKTV